MDVRDLFERSLRTPEPPMTDAADLVRRAESVRRRTRNRQAAAVAAAVVVVLLAAGSVVALRGPVAVDPLADPTASAADPVAAGPAATAPAGPRKGASAARSGLPWPSGVFPETYQAAGTADAFGQWRGRPVDVAVVSTDMSTWAKLTTDVFVLRPDFFPRDWPGQLVISLGMWPQGQGSLAECAAGKYSAHFEQFGRTLASSGRAGSIVRIGWSANSDRWYWSGADAGQYKTCFRRIATAIRAAAPAVLIDWTVAGHETTTACGGSATNCYPGNDVVDIVGVEMFDRAPESPTAADFDRMARLPDSLYPMLEFARANAKLLAVGAWGVANGDNGVFVEGMLDFFRANAADIAYEAYFNTCNADTDVGSDLYACGPRNPAAATAYRARLGG